MKITISLPQHPEADQIADARALLDFIAAGFKSSAAPAAIAAAAPAAPPPPAPPPPPAAEGEASVFQAQVGGTPAVPAATERDATNLPWDERIHASTKAKNQDGTWKKRRGVGDSYVTQIEAELRAVPGNAAPVAAAPAAPPPPAPPAPPAPAAAAPAAPASDNPFVAMMKKAGPKLADKSLTNEKMVEACKSVGLDSLPALAQRHDLVPTVEAILGLV